MSAVAPAPLAVSHLNANLIMAASSFVRVAAYVRGMPDLRHVKPGDRVLRQFLSIHDLESGPTMELVVTDVDGELI